MLGDANSVKKDKVGRRVGRKIFDKATGRTMKRLFRWTKWNITSLSPLAYPSLLHFNFVMQFLKDVYLAFLDAHPTYLTISQSAELFHFVLFILERRWKKCLLVELVGIPWQRRLEFGRTSGKCTRSRVQLKKSSLRQSSFGIFSNAYRQGNHKINRLLFFCIQSFCS